MEEKWKTKKITFRNEIPADYRAVENLTREAFWNVYKPGCDEHFILHNFRTRSEFVPELDIIMEEEGILVGHVMFARAEIKLNNSKTLPIMTFGPISIAPDFKHKGYGTVLLRYAMEKAKEMDCARLQSPAISTFTEKADLLWQKQKEFATMLTRMRIIF